MDDPRGNLALVFLRIAELARPRWVVWENVPGVLSSNDGRDFAAFLSGLALIGYGFCYRVLDAQYFGVAQRRCRVFVIGHLGDWRPAAAVLFERESLSWNAPPRRKAWEGAAPTISARTKGGGGLGTDFEVDGGLIPIEKDVAPTLDARGGRAGYTDFALDGGLISVPLMGGSSGGTSHGKKSGTDRETMIPCWHDGSPIASTLYERMGSYTMPEKDRFPAVLVPGAGLSVGVRRITPRECERLQGFPDDYTAIPWRGQPASACPVSLRYKALGNSMAVPVIRWLGERIQKAINKK